MSEVTLWVGGIFLSVGLLFAGIGGGLLIVYFRRRKIIAGLRRSGLPIPAKFLETYRETGITVNGRNPYSVICQANHPATGKPQDFKSEAIWLNPSELFKSGDKVRVLVDPAHPKHYFVDLTEEIADYASG